MAFDAVNDKTFPEYEVEKIFQIGQAVKSYDQISIYM